MRSTILGGDTIQKALSDPNFFTQMPEFSALHSKLSTQMAAHATTRHGCSSCVQHRMRSNLQGDFVTILNSLPTSAMQRFKKYLGTESLLVNAYDKSTGKTVLKRY